MSLVRQHDPLGNVIIRNTGDAGGPRSDWVADELNTIIAWAKNSPRRIGFNFASTGNVGTGLDSLHSFTQPLGSLATNGDELICKFGGFFANNDDDKRLVFNYDGNVILDTSLLDIDNFGWWCEMLVGRVTSTSVNIAITLNLGQVLTNSTPALVGTTPGSMIVRNSSGLAVANLNSNNVTILVQGESATATNNNVVQNYSTFYLAQQ